MKRYLGTLNSGLLLTLGATLLFACGGGGSSSDGEGPEEILDPSSLEASSAVSQGAFIDSAVSGMAFTSDSNSGFTGPGGNFPFTEGESIAFSIGDISLPTIASRRTITPLDIFSTSDINDTRVVNLSRLLQTLDADGDLLNGILIDNSAHAAAGGLNIQFDSPDFDTEVTGLIANAGSVNNTLIGETEALAHLQSTLDSIQAPGEYYEVYGAMAGDYDFTTGNRELLGTSDGGPVFDVRGYDRFIIYVPPSSSTVYINGFSFAGDLIVDDWNENLFAPGGILRGENVHRLANFNVTAVDGLSSLNILGGVESICEIDCSGWWPGSLPVENFPSGETIHSTPGQPSYYSFTTNGADYLRVYTVQRDFFATVASCGYSTPLLEVDSIFRTYLKAERFSTFEAVVADCDEPVTTGATDIPGTWVVRASIAGGDMELLDFMFNADGSGGFRSSGTSSNLAPFNWSMENNRVKIEMHDAISQEVYAVHFWAIMTSQITTYSETLGAPNFIYHANKFRTDVSEDTDPSDFDLIVDLTSFDDADGFIWSGSYIKL